MIQRLALRGMVRTNRLLADRGLWKDAIYGLAFITYFASFLFFILAVGEIAHHGAFQRVLIDLLLALYFLIQVLFLFALSWFVERRRETLPIRFPDRRRSTSQGGA